MALRVITYLIDRTLASHGAKRERCRLDNFVRHKTGARRGTWRLHTQMLYIGASRTANREKQKQQSRPSDPQVFTPGFIRNERPCPGKKSAPRPPPDGDGAMMAA